MNVSTDFVLIYRPHAVYDFRIFGDRFVSLRTYKYKPSAENLGIIGTFVASGSELWA
jgi:hypothetical protein